MTDYEGWLLDVCAHALYGIELVTACAFCNGINVPFFVRLRRVRGLYFESATAHAVWLLFSRGLRAPEIAFRRRKFARRQSIAAFQPGDAPFPNESLLIER